MPDYRRLHLPGRTWFFTVNLLERRRRLLVEHVDVLRRAFANARKAQPFQLIAVVVLPDHLHCLWRLAEGDTDNAGRWSRVKAGFSRRLPPYEWRNRSRIAKRERGIWQRRFWARLILDEKDLHSHVDYIHFNPVKHGHSVRAVEWPHSSIHAYIARGWLPADWAGGASVESAVSGGLVCGHAVGRGPPYG